MSDILTALLAADGNSAAARRARVALQPRDKYGRWVTTGARLFASLSLGGGKGAKVRGRAIGGTNKKGQIRMLVGKGYEKYGIPENTVLTVDSKNGELFEATLDRNFLKKKGIDPDLKHSLPENLIDQPQTLEQMDPKPADALDIDLATNGLSDNEDRDLRKERDQEPLAKLPPAMDVAEGEEVKQIVEAAEEGQPTVPEDSPELNTPFQPLGERSAALLEDAGLTPEDVTEIDKALERTLPNTRGRLVKDRFNKAGASDNIVKDMLDAVDLSDGAELPDVSKDLKRILGNVDVSLGTSVRDRLNKLSTSVDSSAEAKDPIDKLISDIFEADENQKPEIDALINEARAAKPEKTEDIKPKTILKFYDEMNPGDIILQDGIEGVVQTKPRVLGATKDGRKIVGVKIAVNGKVQEFRFASQDGYQVIKGRKGEVLAPETEGEAAPAPTAKPTKPKAKAPAAEPEQAPEQPAPTPAQEPMPEPEKISFKPTPRAGIRRADDGKNITEQVFSEEELTTLRNQPLDDLVDAEGKPVMEFDSKGKPHQAKDPNAMLNALANAYKNSKFNQQGHLVLMRERSKAGGKDITWEIKAANTGDKKVAYLMSFKDNKTGEVTTYMHKDARDSVTSLFGTKNGPQELSKFLRGTKLGRDGQPIRFGSFSTDPNQSPADNVKYFVYNQNKAKSIKDHAKTYAEGVAARYNSSNGTRLEAEVPPIIDAFLAGDSATTLERARAVFGRIPIDQQSHDEALEALRELYKNKFGTPKEAQSFSALLSSASSAVRKQQFDTPETRAIPRSSADNIRIIEEGMTVEYTNNIDQVSVVKVVKYQKVNSATPKQSTDIFDFGDYVTIIDANGKRSSLPTTKLRILKDQNTPLTEFKGRVQGERLREARGFYSPTSLRFPTQGSIPDATIDTDDLQPGDSFYGRDGIKLGQVVEVVPMTGKDGAKGYGVMYVDKEGGVKTVAVASGETRGPKIEINGQDSEGGPEVIIETESDPNFDLDGVTFETDPTTVEKPKTVSLSFTLPKGAKRNEEQQLILNEEIQKELDAVSSVLANKMPEGWSYDASSFSSRSFFSSEAFDNLVEKARAEYPDLSDAEIRTLLELRHAKASGFFLLSKQQIINKILQEPATYTKADGALRLVQIEVDRDKETGLLDFNIDQKRLSEYMKAFEDIEKFATKANLLGFNPDRHSLRIAGTKSNFANLYQSATRGMTRTTRYEMENNILGVNISLPWDDQTMIYINNGLLADGGAPEGFANPVGDTVTHEFGHTVHRNIGAKFNQRDYGQAYNEFVSKYGGSSINEHFAESFAKYIQTGEASPGFLEYLKFVGILTGDN